MILTALISAVFAIIVAIISILPNGGTFPPQIATTLATIWAGFKAWDFILPTGAITSCLLIGISFWAFVLVWRGVHWLLRKIPWLSMT